ncbi:hypothetical protein [Terrimonas alba]|uniref:hypothetical protein n=1 Tax=Terrimonas alba TaxID=3349636 RepID=UPI0035F36131
MSVGLFAQVNTAKKQRQTQSSRLDIRNGSLGSGTNLNSPRNHVISFYINDNILMYKETLKDVKLSSEKRAVKMKLKKRWSHP